MGLINLIVWVMLPIKEQEAIGLTVRLTRFTQISTRTRSH